MDSLLSVAPAGVLDTLVSTLVEFVCAGCGLCVVLWFFGLAWEIVVGLFRDVL